MVVISPRASMKRRVGLKVHAQAPGLDQIPEALLPLLVLRRGST